MNRHDFSVEYAKRAGITQEASAKTCEEVFDLLFDCIGSNDRVYIKGLGTFTHVTKKPRRVGNFGGGIITIPEREDIKFLPYQGATDAPPDPMASPASTTPAPTFDNDAAAVSQAIVTSITELGVPEFVKRLGVMTAATKNDIYSIARRETTRNTKLICPCCGKEFYKRFSHQRFCSGKCREENARRARTEFSAYEHDHGAGGRNVTINL